MIRYSLRRRLLLWLFLATILIGLLALIDTWREALRTAQGVSDRVLVGSALAIAERVTVDETGVLEVDIPYSSLEMLTSTAQDKVFYRVDGPIGTFLTGYDDLPVVPAPQGGVAFADGQFGNVGIRSATLQREVSTGARSIAFSVTVAESTLARSALARAILVRSALRLAALILGVAGIVWVAVTLSLRPLDRLGAIIAERSPGDLRPVTANVPQEVAALVNAINSFMARLDTALVALRHFTGNASHQLRTPLAVVRTQIALIDRSATPELAAAATAKALVALERAERVLAQLLVLARVDAATGAALLQPVNIVAIAKDLTAEVVPKALQRGIDLGYEGPQDAMAMAEPVLLGELLMNLLDNAIAYAGPGAVVTVRVGNDAGAIVLEVEDNGPGLSAKQMTEARHPKRDMPMRAALKDQDSGYGLGLAIASEIAALFHAELLLQTGSEGRGLRATVRFSA
ncbi:two-component system, OmpR family, sensor histidine kinase TctE [Gemmobacter aquatilis]|uniref:histidine kinase n=1 Tax=Gemmobacter aquatilis TaxID=933059 RepID=A0A1H8N5U8_9RHOB|nr:sensor histidine kinase [Gemmobacter aquatilis]SEO24987.1 two-component system, OmpR family, sensor histidine kinase TctE [Gemmobacter aquatilis]